MTVHNSLEAFFRKHLNKGIIDYSVRAHEKENGHITFYIHPSGCDGDTVDFEVSGLQLVPDPDISYLEDCD